MASKIQNTNFYLKFLRGVSLFIFGMSAYLSLSASENASVQKSKQEKGSWDIYLVRHAEKEKNVGKNPHLTHVGKLRAQNIAKMLKDKNIKVVYSTEYARTLETAKPIADNIGTNIQPYDPRKLKEFAQSLKAKYGNALIVGHSNTTPQLVTILGGAAGDDMDESEYDRVYKLTLNGNSVATSQVSTKILRSLPKQ